MVVPPDGKEIEKVHKESFDFLNEINRRTKSTQETLDEATALLDTTDDLREQIEIQNRITSALEMRDSFAKLTIAAQEAKDRADKLVAGSQIETRRELLLLSIYTVLAFAAGIAAEWCAIAGILKVLDARTAAMFAAGATVLITCNLALESWRALLRNNQIPAMNTKMVTIILEGITLVITCSPAVLIPLLTHSL